MEKVITDQDWLSVIKNASDFCVENGLKSDDLHQSSINVTKEECDARYIYFIDCLISYSKFVSI